MTKPLERDTIYRCRRFSAETIELCVRWYSKTIGLSNSGAHRCWDSSPFGLQQLLSRESNWRIAFERDSICYR